MGNAERLLCPGAHRVLLSTTITLQLHLGLYNFELEEETILSEDVSFYLNPNVLF